MDDSADKKLAARYKEVFDDYRDEGAAEGWALLQQKRKKPKPFPYYWLSGAAALLLLAVGLGWYFVDGNSKQEMVNGRKSKVESGESGVVNSAVEAQSSKSGVGSSKSEKLAVKTDLLKKDKNLLAEKSSSKTAKIQSRNSEPVLSNEKPNTDAVFYRQNQHNQL